MKLYRNDITTEQVRALLQRAGVRGANQAVQDIVQGKVKALGIEAERTKPLLVDKSDECAYYLVPYPGGQRLVRVDRPKPESIVSDHALKAFDKLAETHTVVAGAASQPLRDAENVLAQR